MLYFAYGSNLSTTRLQERVPSAELIATGKLRQHRLIFHKIGRDGSAKCNAMFTGKMDDMLYGAVFRIDPEQKKNLDQAEGLGRGYEIKQVDVLLDTSRVTCAFLYYATRIDNTIKPFHWYKKHVLLGAKEHCFPMTYIEQIKAVAAIFDTNSERTERERSIYATCCSASGK